jgi:3-isopropylmalate/(R)-2-methylmalate dehydratase small subunit
VGGRNFGCGSSREHAPWALLDYGFRAVISSEIADIFSNNSLKNGLVPVLVDQSTLAWLLEHPGVEVTIDLESTTLQLPDARRISFPLGPFDRYCLLNGVDELGFLLSQQTAIAAFEARPSITRAVRA